MLMVEFPKGQMLRDATTEECQKPLRFSDGECVTNEEESCLPHGEALDLFAPFDKNQLHYQTKKKKSIRTIEGVTERDTRYNVKDVLEVRQRLIQRASRKGKIPTVDTDWMYPSDLPVVNS